MTDDAADNAEKLAAAVAGLPPADMERVARLVELYAEAPPAAKRCVDAVLAQAKPDDGIEEIRARQTVIVEYLEEQAKRRDTRSGYS